MDKLCYRLTQQLVMLGWCGVAERLVIGVLLTLGMHEHSLTAMVGWRLTSSGYLKTHLFGESYI
jgi:hypothetical protein